MQRKCLLLVRDRRTVGLVLDTRQRAPSVARDVEEVIAIAEQTDRERRRATMSRPFVERPTSASCHERSSQRTLGMTGLGRERNDGFWDKYGESCRSLRPEYEGSIPPRLAR